MPYITQQRRAALELSQADSAETPGELNYMLTRLCLKYLRSQGTSYAALNDVVGALECAKHEFYRRAVLPYENAKLAENGDVYNE